LYEFADASFKGRAAGTIDELNAAVWVAERYRTIGLQPAGDNNSYFQFFNMWRNRIAETSTVSMNDRPLTLWSEVAIAQMAPISIDQPIVYLGKASTIDFKNIDVKGKVVAFDAVPGILNNNISLPTWRYQRYMMASYGNALVEKGALALILIADNDTEFAWPDAVENFKNGFFDLEGGPNEKVTATVPVFWVHESAKKEITVNKAQLKANIIIERFSYPSASEMEIAQTVFVSAKAGL
jgi:hypothetical protein